MKQYSILKYGFMALSASAMIGCAQPSAPVARASAPLTPPQVQQPAQAPVQDDMAIFLGVWSKDDYPIVEISRRGDGGFLLVREFYGKEPSDNVGIEYPAALKGKQLVAQLGAKHFYKHEIPTFTLLPNGNLRFDSGVGPAELVRTNKPMIKAKFGPPHWSGD